MNAHDHELPAIDGGTIRLADYAGAPILLVNTASECGFTPQYAELQALHERYRDRGFAVIGIPSNDFGEQEPGDEAAIASFCESRYGVNFPLATKLRVVPPDEHPLYAAIASELGDVARPRWNFHKYLIGPDGDLLGLWESSTRPQSAEILEAVEQALASAAGGAGGEAD